MGCGGFHELFRVYDSRNTGYNDRRPDDTQEKISLIKRLYAEGRIGKDRYYSLKDRAYDGNLSFEQLMDIKESSRDNRENSSLDSGLKEDKPKDENKSINKYKHHFTTFYHAASLNEIKLCKQSFKFP